VDLKAMVELLQRLAPLQGAGNAAL
jgi:hypothetical protein